mgnify:CR=1 FL=1
MHIYPVSAYRNQIFSILAGLGLAVALAILCPVDLIAQNNRAELEEAMRVADSLYNHFEEAEALRRYEAILEESPMQYMALWRSSYLYSRVGNRQSSEDEMRAFFNRGIQRARQALDVDSSDVYSNFVMSVAQGRKALIAGASERVAASREIRHYVERALSFNDEHAGSWHVLGRWHAKMSNLSFAERMAAKYLFGGTPPASVEEAFEALEKAVELKPDFILYRYDLASLYEREGKDRKAIEVLKGTVNLEPKTPDDPENLKKSRALLNDLQ